MWKPPRNLLMRKENPNPHQSYTTITSPEGFVFPMGYVWGWKLFAVGNLLPSKNVGRRKTYGGLLEGEGGKKEEEAQLLLLFKGLAFVLPLICHSWRFLPISRSRRIFISLGAFACVLLYFINISSSFWLFCSNIRRSFTAFSGCFGL